jgi:nucleotide-binding universal stress UspA family protein
MNERIIVGITDAQASRRALDWATRRAADRHQSLLLVSIVGGAVGAVGEGRVVDAALERTQEMLDREAARIAEFRIPVETRIGRGDPVEQLIRAAENSALLVIGSDYRGHGLGPVRGHRGIRIVAGAHCPVVVVPDIDVSERSGVIVGVDGSEISEAAIDFAAAEAERRGETLTAISTWSPLAVPMGGLAYPDDYVENMEKLTAENLGISVAGLRQDYPDLHIEQVVESGLPGSILSRHGATASLVVVGSHGRGAFRRFLLGSVSEEVLARLTTVTAVVR